MNNKHFVFFICIISLFILFITNKIFSYYQIRHNMPDTLIQIKEANSDKELSNIFSTTDSKISLIVIYTSWCSSCIKKIPEINKIIGENENINPIIISLDEDKNKLLHFLSRQSTVNFIPYNVSPHHIKKLLSHLTKKGINFNNNIPYIAVLYDGIPPITNIGSINQLKLIIKNITEEYNIS
ncbi:thioredoxin family protein [Ehrlichia sp. JZT12]